MVRNAKWHAGGKRRRAALIACLLLTAATAHGGTYKHFPGAMPDQRTLRVQEQVEELYNARDYARALLIYEKELAPAGDKYAQYMVGYMNLTGRGVAEDATLALAWYRLAAERNDKPFVLARDALSGVLDSEQKLRSDAFYKVLWQRIGDRKLLLNLLQKDVESLQVHENASAGDDIASVTLVSGFLGSSARDDAIERVRQRMQSRL
jgi:TPR repeat protein